MKYLSQIIVIRIVLISTLTFQSCTKENVNENSDDKNSPVSSRLEVVDVEFFGQIKKAADIYDKNEVWKGYDFSKQSAYFIYRDANGKPVRGILINPKTVVKGAVKITENTSGLNLYRYDVDLEKLNNALKNGNDAFDFYFKIDGHNYYGQHYNDASIKNDFGGAIALAVHEMFHVYQDKWTINFDFLQNEEKYPITKELLELQLLSTKIALKMPTETNKVNIKKYLEMYVAIRSKEMELDPSSEKFVKNMANAQENGEGTAKYIEVLASCKILPNYDQVFGDIQFTEILTKERVREFFAFSIWYDTGAAVVHMLKNQGVQVEEGVESGKTLFDIANDFVKLSEVDKATKLQDAKNEFDWTAIQEEANRLINL